MNGVIQLIILGYARYGRQGCLRHLYLRGVEGTGVGTGARLCLASPFGLELIAIVGGVGWGSSAKKGRQPRRIDAPPSEGKL